MSNDLSIFSSTELKEIVQDMRDMLSQNQLAFLLGAGCSVIAGLPLMRDLTDKVLNHPTIADDTKKLLTNVQESFTGAKSATIEDYMSEIVDLLSIAERRAQRGANKSTVTVGNLVENAEKLHLALDEIKRAIISIITEAKVNISTHQQFVRAIHGSLQAGKENREVDYFILNYDTLIEDALGLERVPYCDGFIGSTTGWWESNTLTKEKKISRIFKVHGSIDWCLLKDDSIPRRIRSGIKTESETSHVLIYPAATKYQETQRDPFAKILQYMRETLSPSEMQEMVLVICGYSFGDSHINSEIEKAISQSEGRLTIIAFVNTDKPEGTLLNWLSNEAISDQIKVYANKGFFHGKKEFIQTTDLLWWKFEILTQLLGGKK
ncbi:MAG: hypothetical protein GYA55_03500 [SAR324 cluster bacterium]|uniref:SIR2-like domain-containing protein n=1 Tax=SAR324 cluster bacterium TaxID=2024889 RepID=A0A7X9FQ28_9DELT|nr:hypothetical protein [SAR324 cluster bacterium]